MTEPRTYRALVWRQFRRRRTSLASLGVVGALFAVALGADFISSDRPLATRFRGETYVLPNLFDYSALRAWDNVALADAMGAEDWAIFPLDRYGPQRPDLPARLQPPSGEHWFGTDELGRDVFARIVHGARISLSVGFVAVFIYVLLGLFLGALAGYYGGRADAVISRMVEVMLSFPTLILILAIMGMVERTSIYTIMVVIGLTRWTDVTRLIRGEILRVREMEYIQASRALGGGDARIILRHVLPNAIAPVLVAATFGVAGAILIESSLSFLGFGTPPPAASWGQLLTQAHHYVGDPGAWWLTVYPGLAIFVTVTAYNLVGEGLRDALDPRLKR